MYRPKITDELASADLAVTKFCVALEIFKVLGKSQSLCFSHLFLSVHMIGITNLILELTSAINKALLVFLFNLLINYCFVNFF